MLRPLAADTAPWWGSAAVTVLAAIAAVLLVVAGVQWWATLALRRQARARWDELRLETAVQLLHLVGELAAGRRPGRSTPTLTPGPSVAAEMHRLVARFALIGSPGLREAAVVLCEAALRQDGAAFSPSGRPLRSYPAARAAFTDAVRRELGAPPGPGCPELLPPPRAAVPLLPGPLPIRALPGRPSLPGLPGGIAEVPALGAARRALGLDSATP